MIEHTHTRRFVFLLGGITLAILQSATAEVSQTPAADSGINLPPPRLQSDVSVEQTLLKRRSRRTFAPRALTPAELSQLLWAAQGITETTYKRRTAPSAGATYPLVLYTVTSRGVHRYLPEVHRLERCLKRDLRPVIADVALGQNFIRRAPLTVVMTAVKERTTRRYGDRGEIYIHMEAGHAAQNLLLQAVALELNTVPIGAFSPARLAQVLKLPANEHPLYLISIGAAQGASDTGRAPHEAE